MRSAEEAEQVDVIDVAARRQSASIPVGKRPGHRLPAGRLPRLRGQRAGGQGYAIDVAAGRVVAEIRRRPVPQRHRSAPGRQAGLVSNGRDGSVMAIDVASHRVLATIPVGKRPWNMALTPTGPSSTWPTGVPAACR